MDISVPTVSDCLAKRLEYLAEKYENVSFLKDDPSLFMHRYAVTADVETVAFIAAMLSFGRRQQILLKIDSILRQTGPSPSEWVRTGNFTNFFPISDKKFYRFYSYTDMRCFFSELQAILKTAGSLGNYFRTIYRQKLITDMARRMPNSPFLIQSLISNAFQKSSVVPKNDQSACKRIHMFLRWMVRTDSPVDMGLWTWYSPRDLIIPLDTHVLSESVKLGLFGPGVTGKTGNAQNALRLTKTLGQIWPEDPCKGDFALFGLGIDPTQNMC